MRKGQIASICNRVNNKKKKQHSLPTWHRSVVGHGPPMNQGFFGWSRSGHMHRWESSIPLGGMQEGADQGFSLIIAVSPSPTLSKEIDNKESCEK